MTKLKDLTPQHLGWDATETDLREFQRLARLLAVEKGIDEDEAAELLFGDGDWPSNALQYGIKS